MNLAINDEKFNRRLWMTFYEIRNLNVPEKERTKLYKFLRNMVINLEYLKIELVNEKTAYCKAENYHKEIKSVKEELDKMLKSVRPEKRRNLEATKYVGVIRLT